ncbi:hypothetical protein PI124_g6800 [Phytophthora idaei]|nr:hypothetical protein PI125_g7255 [Phytophthora idaei]KAG3160027.1 hypothetical protein PI126_g7079 [Phytophthora idaei]KAG3248510.1 hypothetical protein PI124_g6800 [Phytophthora idaei]
MEVAGAAAVALATTVPAQTLGNMLLGLVLDTTGYGTVVGILFTIVVEVRRR